jgi:hypothetical protein
VDTVARVPGTLVERGRSARALAALEREYAKAPAQVRARIDSTLDAVDSLASRSFSRLGARRRVELLVAAASGSGAGPVADEAVALAAAPFHPSGFRWDPAAGSLWLRVAGEEAA